MSRITFVTSYFKIYDDEYDSLRPFKDRVKLFSKIADSGINICLFTSSEYYQVLKDLEYTNVKVIESSLDDSTFITTGYSLPKNRNISKDTDRYMVLMNSKIEYIKKAIDINPFSSDYFAWFDFGLAHVFKNDNSTELKFLSNFSYTKTFLAMPGCLTYKVGDVNHLKNQIAWRFCGGFFIGDKNTLIDFYNVSITRFHEFLSLTQTLVWEVNYWAWLEANNFITPIWYHADHNDTIIYVPHDVL